MGSRLFLGRPGHALTFGRALIFPEGEATFLATRTFVNEPKLFALGCLGYRTQRGGVHQLKEQKGEVRSNNKSRGSVDTYLLAIRVGFSPSRFDLNSMALSTAAR